jgi:protocatechuate 3,4-dioxygenase beta subunit
VKHGDSIASEGKGDCLYVEGKVVGTDGRPIADAVIETWEADGSGASVILCDFAL